jgi:hypothetical protein
MCSLVHTAVAASPMTTFGEVRSSGSSFRTFLANYSIALVSLVLSYFLIEFSFFE